MSLSIGPRGAKLNISKKGAYINSNLPGSGIYNKTKVSTCLLWAVGVCLAIGGLGYVLGIALQNFNLFVVMCCVAIVAGIATFFIARHIKRTGTEETEEEELPATRNTSKKKATTRKGESTKGATKGSTKGKKTATRTDNAPAKAYTDEVERLLGKMAEAQSVDELDKWHREILDIMYTNVKPLDTPVLGMDFDEALSIIEKEYSAGLQQLSESHS
jgi:hypothetical protein